MFILFTAHYFDNHYDKLGTPRRVLTLLIFIKGQLQSVSGKERQASETHIKEPRIHFNSTIVTDYLIDLRIYSS